MKNCFRFFISFLSLYAYPCLGDTVYKQSYISCPDRIVVETRLAQAIEIRDCKGISGMTCRIVLRSNAAAVPSEIFIQEFGSKGQKLGPPFPPDLSRPEEGRDGLGDIPFPPRRRIELCAIDREMGRPMEESLLVDQHRDCDDVKPCHVEGWSLLLGRSAIVGLRRPVSD